LHKTSILVYIYYTRFGIKSQDNCECEFARNDENTPTSTNKAIYECESTPLRNRCTHTTHSAGLAGGDDETRTRDLRRDRPEVTTQNTLQTLGETQPTEKSVTQNVTFLQKNVTQEALVEALKCLSKEELLELLGKVLSGK